MPPFRTLSAGNYTTFLLRALGYDGGQGDFEPGRSLSFAAGSGITSLGITAGGTVRVGRPALFTRIQAPGASWTAYEINVSSQYGSVLYTPAYGSSVAIKKDGHVMTVAGGSITGYRSVPEGEPLSIPAGGCLVYMDFAFTSAPYFQPPAAGTPVTMEYYLAKDDPEGFTLDGLVSVVSGAPRLVKDGSTVTTLEAGFIIK